MRMLTAFIKGAAVGVGIAIIMIPLDQLGPFSVTLNSFIDRVIFRLCPFYVLGFSKDITSKTAWFLVTIVGNAFVYGAIFALLAICFGLVRKAAVHSQS
jgi:hypothetical protein